jgi:hypothetical protein
MGAELDAGGFGERNELTSTTERDSDLPRFGALVRR